LAVVIGWAVFSVLHGRTIPTTSSQVQAEVDWLPPGIEKGEGAVIKAVDGKKFYDRIVKVLPNDRRIPFRLIPRENDSDPPTFYMMENKVDNALFLLASEDKDFQTKLEEFRKEYPWAGLGEWNQGGVASGENVGISDGSLPVLRVSVVEAYHLASWLKGRLPSVQQWEKAAGRFNGDDGPFTQRLENGDVGVGLGKTGPLPTDRKKCPVSRFGIRDMAGNGREWTRNIALNNSRTVPVKDPKRDELVVLRGNSYVARAPLLFTEIDQRSDSMPYEQVSPFTSFRVVLEP
jgi:formylglycine-generating enzyme required for sulfatase activity